MCTHEISAHFTVADMAQKCDIRKNPGCWGEDYDKTHQVTWTKFPFSPSTPGNQPDICRGPLPRTILHQHGAFPCRHWQAAMCSLPHLWPNSSGPMMGLKCWGLRTTSEFLQELVLFLFGHNLPGVWRTGLPRNPTLHLGHRRGESNSLSKLSLGKSS